MEFIHDQKPIRADACYNISEGCYVVSFVDMAVRPKRAFMCRIPLSDLEQQLTQASQEGIIRAMHFAWSKVVKAGGFDKLAMNVLPGCCIPFVNVEGG